MAKNLVHSCCISFLQGRFGKVVGMLMLLKSRICLGPVKSCHLRVFEVLSVIQ